MGLCYQWKSDLFERKPIPDLGVLPDSAAGDLLPECQIVVLSATTLLNQTIDGLLAYCKAAREIAILGPSTPFSARSSQEAGRYYSLGSSGGGYSPGSPGC